MPHADFVPLRVHSAYSLSEGAIPVKTLVKLCKQQGMPAVAVTDTGNLFGALEFAQTAQKEGVQPIVGCQLQVTRELPTRESGEPRNGTAPAPDQLVLRSEEHTSELQSLMRLSYAVFCLK